MLFLAEKKPIHYEWKGKKLQKIDFYLKSPVTASKNIADEYKIKD